MLSVEEAIEVAEKHGGVGVIVFQCGVDRLYTALNDLMRLHYRLHSFQLTTHGIRAVVVVTRYGV